MRSLRLRTVLRGNDIRLSFRALFALRRTSGRVRSFLQTGRPVQNDRHRIWSDLRRREVDQEALTGPTDVGALGARRREEVLRSGSVERGDGADLNDFPLIRRFEVNELTAAARPSRAVAAGSRHLPLLAGRRKGLNKNLPLSGLVRVVGEPPAVGRKTSLIVAEWSRDQWSHFPVAREREQPEVGFALRIANSVEQPSPVRSHVERLLPEIRFQQKLFRSGAAHRLLVEIPDSRLVRAEVEALAVGRPDGVRLACRVECELRTDAARDVEDPDVGAAGRRVETPDRDPGPVRRDSGVVGVLPIGSQSRDLRAGPIEPDELPRRWACALIRENAALGSRIRRGAPGRHVLDISTDDDGLAGDS